MMMLNEKNCKWKTITIEILRRQVSRVSKDINMSTSDSNEYDLINNDYLPGSTLTSAFGKLSSFIVESTKREDKLVNGA